jgi:very-short-patch-repair endonuclease
MMPSIAERLQGVLTYVAKLVELSDKTVFSCRDYRSRATSSLNYFEHELRDREGIALDVQQADGPAWLKISRLPPRDPPTPAERIRDWIEVSRNPKVQPKLIETRLWTMARLEADRLVECGIADRADVMVPPSGDPQMADVRLRLDRQPELKELADKYVNETWPAWKNVETIRRETIAIYNKFFAAYQTIENAGAESPTEAVVGVGVALWQVDNRRIEHPLIELPVEIQLDSSTHAILVRPRDVEPQVYLKPFEELNNPSVAPLRQFANKHFDSLGRDNGSATAGSYDVSPFTPSTFEAVLREAAGRLSKGGIYLPDHAADSTARDLQEATETLTVTDTWAIYARPRSGNHLTRDVERLQEAAKAFTEATLPAIAVRLNADPSKETDYVPPEERNDTERDGRRSSVSAVGESVFFPKPYNDAQLKIVQDLEIRDGLVVQGPPGTGKTHTIANIICHFLATGRRVLVASKGEPALAVLRGQIPEGIRNLAMSLLTKERDGLGQLKGTAEHILSAARSGKDTAYWKKLEQDAAREETNVAQLRRELEQIEIQITSLAQTQLEAFIPKELVGEARLRPKDAAKRIADDTGRFDWLDDPLGHASEFAPQFSDTDINATRSARQHLAGDLVYLGYELPRPEALPDAETFAHLHDALLQAAKLKQRARTDNTPLVNPTAPNAIARIEAAMANLRDLERVAAAPEAAGALRDLLTAWLDATPIARQLQPLGRLCAELLEVAKSGEQFVTRRVTLPAFGEERAKVVAAVERLSEGKRRFPLTALLGVAKAKALLGRIRIASRPPRQAAEWAYVLAKLSHEDETLALAERWNALREETGLALSEAPATAKKGDLWISATAGWIADAKQTAQACRNGTFRAISELFDGRLDPRAAAAPESLAKTIGLLGLNADWVRSSGADSSRNDLLARLGNCSGPVVAEMRAFVVSCLGNPENSSRSIGDGWLRLIAELRRVMRQRAHLDTVKRVAAIVEASGAPKWANRLRIELARSDCDPACPHEWQSAWNHHRIKAYLTAIDGQREMRVLSERKAACERQLANAITELVRLKTCLGLRKKMTDAGRHALRVVVNAITYLTNTPNGALAAYWRRELRSNMPECVRAVPCWIMPTWRVSETVPAELGLFDLVIIDEASQSDALAIPTILRAQRLLVVGDDRQVSPTPIGIPFAKVLQLHESHLKDHPYRTALLPGGSLYDLAQGVFGIAEMLNEHFRCAEPIIRFSFQFYSKGIVPLRIPKDSERLDPPLIDVFVANGRRDARKVNRAEAVAIADEIERLVNDPAYHDRTIGVVTLLGWEQAEEIQELLLQRLGEDTFLRHRISCGDAATFQGNERHIMFVSMVASPGKATAQTARLFEQRFNVALSRARDRMYLFRSVGLEHLPNVRDLKRKVISHFDKPMPDAPPEANEEDCESRFERDFLRRLVKLGYQVRPQVHVGPFRIDLVVVGEKNRRLAIELDGDRWHNTAEKWLEDWGRQKILERMGWTFWRCWASSFYLNPDECIADLVRTLEEMRIQPFVGNAPSGLYTEHRTITVSLDGEAAVDDESPEAVEVGDQVLVSFEDDAQRHCLLELSGGKPDLVNGIISAGDPAGQVLLGKTAEDEVELPWNGRHRRGVIVEIHKGKPPRRRRARVGVPRPLPPTMPPPKVTPPPPPPVNPPAVDRPKPPAQPLASVRDEERRAVRRALEAEPNGLVRWRLEENACKAGVAQSRIKDVLTALILDGTLMARNDHDATRYALKQ